jgi:hypothetical protein
MKRSAELLIAAPLTAALLLGPVACSSEKPQKVILPTEIESPPPVPPDSRLVRMARQILALREAAPASSRMPVDGAATQFWTEVTVPGKNGTVSLHIDSLTKDTSGAPDPANVSSIDIGVNAGGHGTIISFGRRADGGIDAYWSQDGKEIDCVGGVPSGGYAPVAPGREEATLLLNNTIVEGQALTSMQPGDVVPVLPMPQPHA